MNTYIIKEETLTDIADAIREKTQDEEPILVSDFASEIENIPSGGGSDLSEYFVTSVDQSTLSTIKTPLIKYSDILIDENVTSLQGVFENAIYNIPAPKIITSNNVTSTYRMCRYAQMPSIDVSGIDNSNVTTMSQMFLSSSSGDSTLQNIYFGNSFDTKKVTDMSSMFGYRRGLTNLDLSSFETPIVNDISFMFRDCTNLMHIDMRNFNFSSINSYASAFNNVPTGCEIIVKDNEQKTILIGWFPTMTNIKTVAEYEAE